MRKYWFVYGLYWQESLAQRASFLMERFRALVVLISLYSLWNALLSHRPSFAGYDYSQMMTYVFGLNVLRSVVFASRLDEIPMEINQGRLSGFLLKPVHFFVYAFFRDLSEKSVNGVSSIIEITGLYLLFSVTLAFPSSLTTVGLFVLSVLGAILLQFLIGFILGCCGFWTSESSGPRFLLSLILEFTAGAFFPLDILPPAVQKVLAWLPSPYLLFFPMHLFLERVDPAHILQGFCIQWLWIGVLAMTARVVWQRGTRIYGAQGA